jgi:hypothetical protein
LHGACHAIKPRIAVKSQVFGDQPPTSMSGFSLRRCPSFSGEFPAPSVSPSWARSSSGAPRAALVKIPTPVSLLVISVMLALSVIASLVRTRARQGQNQIA